MNCLTVQDLSFSYGSTPVFSGVSLTLKPGQIFCLVGPNGCGKSTLQHCILGHLKPKKGEISIYGKPLSQYRPRELAERMAYVPQSHVRSFPYRAVDIVAMGQMRKASRFLPQREQEDAPRAVMERLHIGHLAETAYTTLSGGELQMVLIARALCQGSDILVLDEPTAHLDVRRTQGILSVLRDIARDEGKAILMSTHDFNHPLQLEDEGADTVMALMERGQLSASGSPGEMLASGLLEKTYGIQSAIVTVDGKKKRRFLAAWSQRDWEESE